VFVLRSTDFLYTLEVPRLRLKEIAAPELEFQVSFVARPGEFEYFGEPLCGEPHDVMAGRLIVESPERFAEWLGSEYLQATESRPAAGRIARREQ